MPRSAPAIVLAEVGNGLVIKSETNEQPEQFEPLAKVITTAISSHGTEIE
jgi:hypothetical protein